MSDAELLKHYVRPIDYYRRHQPTMTDPKRITGWVDAGLCPFHHDKHPRNFRVHLGSGAYICFACDQKGRDIIDFHMKRYGMTFPEALADIATDHGFM